MPAMTDRRPPSRTTRNRPPNRPMPDPDAHLAAIVDSADDGIISKDVNGIIISWNPAAERLLGWTAKEGIGQPITLIVPPEQREEESDILGRILRGERIAHSETVRRRKDGSLLEVALTVSAIKDVTGRIVGVSKIVRDITARKQADAKFRGL